MADYAWASGGGTLLDNTGDISFSTGFAEIQDLVITRLKASSEGWQLYDLSANLEDRIGDRISTNLQTKIQRQVTQALSDILTTGMYQIKILTVGNTMQLYVFVNNTAVATATITPDGVSITGS